MRPRSCSHRPRSPLRIAYSGLALVAFAALPATAAADIRIYGQISGVPAPAPGMGFALHLAREDLALAYDADGSAGDDTETLALRRLGLTLSESLGERARVGLRLGRLWVDQSGRDATAGVDPRGHYLDLALAVEQPLGGPVHATLDAAWRYAIVDADDDAREVELEWQTWSLQPGVHFSLNERAAVRTGMSLVAVKGDERVREPGSSSTTGFTADGHVGGYVALDLRPQPNDMVSFQLEGGPRTGVFVSFEHRY